MPGGIFYPDSAYLVSTHSNFGNWSELVPANTNCTYGIQWIWSFMGQCVMDARGMVAMICGFICLIAWIFNGLPQMIENFRVGIPDQAISPFLLLFWTLGDVSNFIGCILAHQLVLQIVISVYSIVSDLILVAQFVYYKMRHQTVLAHVNATLGDGRVTPIAGGSMNLADSDTKPLLTTEEAEDEETPPQRLHVASSLLGLFTLVTILYPYNGANRIGVTTSSPARLLTSRVDLSLGDVSMWHPPFLPETSAKIGYLLGWISSIMYVCSRFPQIWRNWQRGSTEGLCLGLFFLAVIGNTSYGLQIFVTSLEPVFLLEALPWLIGSVGVLALDIIATLDKHEACKSWRAKDRLRSSLLAMFPCALLGQMVTVTLLDETLVTGRLNSCDGMLNLELEGNVTVRRSIQNGSSTSSLFHMDAITIFGKRIRYITISESINVRESLERWDFETPASSSVALDSSKRLISRPKRAKDKYAHLRSADIDEEQSLVEVGQENTIPTGSLSASKSRTSKPVKATNDHMVRSSLSTSREQNSNRSSFL